MMNICIIGSGVVGTAIGKGFRDIGNNVLFFDVDTSRIELMKRQELQTTEDLNFAVENSELFFVCVPTPDDNGKIDLGILKMAIEKLSKACKYKNQYFLFVIKSTIIPMTSENLIPIIENFSEKKAGENFGVCFNPEFLRDENSYNDFMNPDRIVIGEYDKKSGDMLEQLYSTFRCPIIRTNLRTAEMIKYANNCFYATKISFFNEIHLMCKAVGIDSNIVRKAVQMDRYYCNHPWEHGHSFGGKCLPKDLNAIITQFNDNHIHDPVLLKVVRDINENMKKISS